MKTIPGFPGCLEPKAATFFANALERVAESTADRGKVLAEIFPSLPRRLGRQAFANGIHEIDGANVDLAVWRPCDAGAVQLIEAADASDECLLEIYYHADFEEKTMLFRSRAVAPITPLTINLLGEAQRTNTGDHFEAAICESDLMVRAVESGHWPLVDFNRTVLKLAFIGLPFVRILRGDSLANEELSRMAQDLATEREAAGRRIWSDTNRVIALAPTHGSLARLAGSLEHGDDGLRLAAAEGLTHVKDPGVLAMARSRIEREPVEAIRAALRAATETD